MLNKLRGEIDELSENLNKDIEAIKNTLEGINSRLHEAED